MVQEFKIEFGQEFPVSTTFYPKDFGLSGSQFRRLKELGVVPGLIMFPNGSNQIWVEQTHYASDEEAQQVIEDIREGLELIVQKANEIRRGLTIVPAVVTFTLQDAVAVKVEAIGE
jgi:hypothetical protein